MTTEPKLPRQPGVDTDLRDFWCYSPEQADAYGLQCLEAGRQQGIAEERERCIAAAAQSIFSESSRETEAGPQYRHIGFVSQGRKGGSRKCLHSDVTISADEIRKTLNTSVTGGPFTVVPVFVREED